VLVIRAYLTEFLVFAAAATIGEKADVTISDKAGKT
jgi:hypothetical protein